jgi:DNA-binding response OmpR family regulator
MGVSTPIIALTANAVCGTKEMFLENGFDDFLSKPIDLIEMNTILEKWIAEEKKEEPEEAPEENPDDAEGQADDIIDVDSFRVKGLDISTGIMLSGGNVRNYAQTLEVFYQDNIRKARELNECLQNGDLKLYSIHVHALKSTTALIGAERMSVRAEALEFASHEGDLDYILMNNEAFITDLDALLNDIQEALPKKGAEVDMGALEVDLTRLEAALKEFDVIEANEIADNLENYRQMAGVGAIVAKIQQCMIIGEYDEALELVGGILDT